MIDFSSINFVSVLIAAVVSMAIGFVWYSPKAFGSAWMKCIGMTETDQNKEDMQKSMGIGFLATIISMTFIAIILDIIGASTLTEAVTVAFVLWAATVLPGALHGVAWEKHPMQLVYINTGNALVTYIVGAVILQWWPA
jgi:Na+(H+)/acetate symporter ActP